MGPFHLVTAAMAPMLWHPWNGLVAPQLRSTVMWRTTYYDVNITSAWSEVKVRAISFICTGTGIWSCNSKGMFAHTHTFWASSQREHAKRAAAAMFCYVWTGWEWYKCSKNAPTFNTSSSRDYHMPAASLSCCQVSVRSWSLLVKLCFWIA